MPHITTRNVKGLPVIATDCIRHIAGMHIIAIFPSTQTGIKEVCKHIFTIQSTWTEIYIYIWLFSVWMTQYCTPDDACCVKWNVIRNVLMSIKTFNQQLYNSKTNPNPNTNPKHKPKARFTFKTGTPKRSSSHTNKLNFSHMVCGLSRGETDKFSGMVLYWHR